MNTEQRLAYLEGIIAQLVKSDRYTIQRTLQMLDGRNIQLATGTGTKIGTATTQKLGFFNKTPIVQVSAISAPATPGSSYAQAEAQTTVNSVNAIRSALTNLGLTA